MTISLNSLYNNCLFLFHLDLFIRFCHVVSAFCLTLCFSVLGISDIALGLERVVLCRPLVSSESQWNNSPWSSGPGALGVSLCILTCLPVLIGPQLLKACCMAWKLLQCPCRLIGPHPNCLRPGHNYCRCACEQDCPSVWLVVRPSCDHCRGADV